MQWLKKVLDYIVNKLFLELKDIQVITEATPPPVTPPRPKPSPVDRPSNPINEDWIPFARQVNPKMSTQGKYSLGHPEGAVVHYTSGRDATDKDALGSLEWGRESGFAYLTIAPSGMVYQAHPVTRWGHHAGVSKWSGLGEGVSQKLIGIEIACAGSLKKDGDLFKPWFNATYSEKDVRFVTEEAYGCPTGWYKKYTKEQEESLLEVLMWLKNNNPKIFDFDKVLGHHEVSGRVGLGYWRKIDPGGSLSMPMREYREYLKKLYISRD